MKRKIVFPGEFLAKGDFALASGLYRINNEVYSKYFGILERSDRGLRVIPIKGKYIPREGDYIIGEIIQILYSFWVVDINSPYKASMSLYDGVDEFVDPKEAYLGDFHAIGEVIYAKIKKVAGNNDVQLTMRDRNAKKLKGGIVVEIPHTKIPRLIGKKGSMINLIKEKSKCLIIAGQNGRVWIRGGKEGLAARAVKLVMQEAHTSGLTDKIGKLLEAEK